jgi:hypothetical protein
MLPLVINGLVDESKKLHRRPPLKWVAATPMEAEIAAMRTEALSESPFDPLKLKQSNWNSYMRKTTRMVCMDCGLGRVIAILSKGREIPTEAWGRVFQWFGVPKGPGKKWVVYWFGAEVPRRFPGAGAPLGAEHLNGGYTTPCSTSGIFIYRFEEATRVLVHELLHAACLDPQTLPVPQREAVVETWAELILIALRSRGAVTEAQRLWALQSQWIADTNNRAAHLHHVRGSSQYGWRYMNGRAAIYKQLGCSLPPPSGQSPSSSRFTHPELGD